MKFHENVYIKTVVYVVITFLIKLHMKLITLNFMCNSSKNDRLMKMPCKDTTSDVQYKIVKFSNHLMVRPDFRPIDGVSPSLFFSEMYTFPWKRYILIERYLKGAPLLLQQTLLSLISVIYPVTNDSRIILISQMTPENIKNRTKVLLKTVEVVFCACLSHC